MSDQISTFTKDSMDRLFFDVEERQRKATDIEKIKLDSYYEGFRFGVDQCKVATNSRFYSIEVPSPESSVRNAFYELCKALDIKGSDIYDAGLSVDETASKLADRIREVLDSYDAGDVNE